ncbi:long chain acyl-CoA synthetase 5 [Arachis duranensis]|uniref:Long chain acyl-CoA synthetase 5 n=1 Tax=Arachis duranensis TaxID=130453 RepID=A0A6P4DH09_ARADU|nr:long chain acyl-CoA synthetase 5 [Arachis duranensis]
MNDINCFESFLVAVANPSKPVLERWAEENGIKIDFDSLCKDSRAKSYILGELTRIAKENKLKGYEFIKDVHLDPVPFDMERDLITPTYKMKRPQLLKYYKSITYAVYDVESTDCICLVLRMSSMTCTRVEANAVLEVCFGDCIYDY